MRFRLMSLIALIYYSLCSYTNSNTVASCLGYESNTSFKWCRNSTTLDSGYACSVSDYNSAVCGGSTSYRCSIDSQYLPQNSKKLLCPTDSDSCNTQILTLATNSSSVSATSKYFSTNTLCWYKFTPSDNTTKSIKVYMSSLFSAKAEVYVEYSNIIYYYQGSITFGESMNITLSSNYPVWVLVTPSSSNAYVSMTASSSPYYYVSSSTLPVLLIVILVIVSFCCCCFLFIIVPMIICNIILKKIRKSKKRKAQYTDTNQPITDEKNYQDEFPLDLNPPKTIKKADTKTTYSIPRFPIQSSARESNVHISQKVLNADQHVEYDPSLPVPSKQTLMTKQTDIMTRKL